MIDLTRRVWCDHHDANPIEDIALFMEYYKKKCRELPVDPFDKKLLEAPPGFAGCPIVMKVINHWLRDVYGFGGCLICDHGILLNERCLQCSLTLSVSVTSGFTSGM